MRTQPVAVPHQPHKLRPRLILQIKAVQSTVAEHYGYSPDCMTSRLRTEPIATNRQVAMYLARHLTGAPFQLIARTFNRSDPSTIMHAVNVLPSKMATDRKLTQSVALLRKSAGTAIAAIAATA